MTLLDRIPQVMWRGRTFDPEYPERDALRRDFVGCAEKFKAAGLEEEAGLWNVEGGSYMLTDLGDFRCVGVGVGGVWVCVHNGMRGCLLRRQMQMHGKLALIPSDTIVYKPYPMCILHTTGTTCTLNQKHGSPTCASSFHVAAL